MLHGLSLKARLVLGVLVLAAAVLAAADIATYTSLGSFLIQRTDSTLESNHDSVDHSDGRGPGRGPGPRGSGSNSSFFVQYRLSDGTTVVETELPSGPGTNQAPAPRLPAAISMKSASNNGQDV